MNYIFKENTHSCYNRIKTCEFSRPLAKSVYRASKSVLFLEPTKWNMALDDYKYTDNVNTFKNKIKHNGILKIVFVHSTKFMLVTKVSFDNKRETRNIQLH